MSVQHVPGLIKVVVRNNFIGVVAEKQWQAAQAAKDLKVSWKPGPGLPAQKDFYEYHAEAAVTRCDARKFQRRGRQAEICRARFESHISRILIRRTVRLVHRARWPMSRRITRPFGQPTQSVYPTQHGVSALTGLPLDSVRVIFVRGSGCYGLNAADTVSFDAALLSQAVHKPVRVQLTRQDEFISENYGSACVIEQQVGINANGAIQAWDCDDVVCIAGRKTRIRKARKRNHGDAGWIRS